MKKTKLLVALLICTSIGLQANAATEVGDWSSIVNAFKSGGEYSLKNDVQADKIIGIEESDTGSNAAYFFGGNVNLDLNNHILTGNGAEYIDSLFEIGDQLGAGGHNSTVLNISNGTISGYINASSLSGNTPQPSAGTIGVYNSGGTKEFNLNFTNNTNDVGGAIANITTNLNEGENSVISGISGNFTNNKAKFLGGAIYNAGVNIGNNDERFENYEIIRNLNSQITIKTKDGNNTVFSGNNAQIGGAIFNTGTVNIDAGESGQVLFDTVSDSIYNDGVLNIVSGITTVNSNISDESKTISIGQFTSKVGGEGITNIKDGATLILGDGMTIQQKEINVNGILGGGEQLKIIGALKVGETGIVDVNADAITSDVTNNGELSLAGGTLTQNIKGDGIITIWRNVINNSKISQRELVIEPDENGTLTTNIDDITISSGEIQNGGKLVLTGGTNKYAIKNSTEVNGEPLESIGITIIQGNVTNESTIAQAVNVQSGILISNADNITGAMSINSGATYNIIGGNVGNILTMSNDSTLSLLGEAKDVTIDKLAIANGDIVNLKFDWGDTFNSSSSEIKGSLNVTEINLASTNGTEAKYTFTNLGDKVGLDSNITLSNVTAQTNNFVTYNNTNGELFSKRRTLAGAVDETEMTETNTYAMAGNESAGNETLTGSLTVQGNGNSITGGGITVGDGTTTGSVLTLKDVNFDNITVEGDSKGAIHVNGGNELNVIAEAADLTVKGTTGNSSSAIYLQKDDTNGAAKATINAQGGSIIISDDIMSNDKDNQVVFIGNKDIKFSGKFDPVLATVNMSGAELERSGQDIDIDWNLNGGTLKYTNDNFLSGGTNSINFNGGSLDLRNGAVNYIDLAGLTLSNNSNLYLDADLANETMDSFNTENISVANNSAKLHVAGFNLISDATKDKTTINFVPQESGLTGYVDYTGKQGITALSPIYKYNVTYDETNGDFNFTRFAAGGGYNSYNPAVMASPVAAQLGGYLTQLNSYDQAFRNMDMYMLMTSKQREAMKLRNKYAAADSNLVFDPTGSAYDDKAVWVRPYATFENVPLKNGPKVSNVAYGSFFGADSELYDLGHGWDGMLSVYAGYNGSHQAYDGIGIYQNGGTLGITGMAYKGNFFTGLTLNAGANVGEANTAYGNDNFTMLMAGIANKTGYNIELADGKFIIQPNVQLSYSFVNTFDYTNAAGVKMNSDPLNTIQVEPGIKFIGNLKNGWQPYAGVSVVWNIMDKTNFKANDVTLPELSAKPYVRYGVGVRKTWGEVCTGFLQTYFTNGGRNGVGLQAGFRFTLGKGGLASIKTSNNMPELPATKIMLSNGGR